MQMLRMVFLGNDADPLPVRIVRRRVQLWLVLNLTVVTLPLALRSLVWLFLGDATSIKLWNLEEVFFFALFLVASALADVYDHCKNEGYRLALPVDRYFAGLVVLAVVMAATYGVAFSGVRTMGWPQLTFLGTITLIGVFFSLRAQFQLLLETILRTRP